MLIVMMMIVNSSLYQSNDQIAIVEVKDWCKSECIFYLSSTSFMFNMFLFEKSLDFT